MRIALFGPPGAGKGTQANLLAERHRLAHISTGNIIRAAIGAATPVGLQVKSLVEAGNLVPDEIMRELAEAAIVAQNYDDFILDGYPRTVQQAEWLSDFMRTHARPLNVVISLDVQDDQIIDRLSKRRMNKETGEIYHLDAEPPPLDVDPALIIERADDNPEAVRERLRIYKADTRPVEDYYRKRGQLAVVDGVGSFEEVYARIEKLWQTDARFQDDAPAVVGNAPSRRASAR